MVHHQLKEEEAEKDQVSTLRRALVQAEDDLEMWRRRWEDNMSLFYQKNRVLQVALSEARKELDRERQWRAQEETTLLQFLRKAEEKARKNKTEQLVARIEAMEKELRKIYRRPKKERK